MQMLNKKKLECFIVFLELCYQITSGDPYLLLCLQGKIIFSKALPLGFYIINQVTTGTEE